MQTHTNEFSQQRLPLPTALKGYIYVCQGENDTLYKIGRTKDTPSKRLKAHRTANPTMQNVLELPCDNPRGVESGLHKVFAQKRRDKEWFALSEEELKAIPSLVARLDTVDVPNENEAEDLKQVRSNGVLLEQTDESRALFQRYRSVKAGEDKLHYDRVCIENEIRVLIGANEGIEGLITWSSSESMRFSLQQFKKDHPDLCQQYTQPTHMRRFKSLGLFDDDSE